MFVEGVLGLLCWLGAARNVMHLPLVLNVLDRHNNNGGGRRISTCTSRDKGNAPHLPLFHRRAQRDDQVGGAHELEQLGVAISVLD